MLVTAGSDTLVGVPWKDSTGACRGDEMRSFLQGPESQISVHAGLKVDGKHPTSYSNLLLAAGKLDRWAEARDPLLPKTTTAG